MPVTYRPLGRTGVQVSPLCLGCMMFGSKTDTADSIKIIHRAVEAGINFLDTADIYNQGRSEEITGQAIKEGNLREQIVLATKVHGKVGPGPNDSGNHAKHIIAGCEASLRRLGTDYIDLYQIHRPQSSIPIDETLRALDRLIRDGKVLYLGTSTFAAWQLMESLAVSRELGLNRFVCEQPPYNLLERRIERELIPFSQTHGFGLIPWSPLAGGLLTGKYRQGDSSTPVGRFSGPNLPPHLQNRLTPLFWERNEKFTAFAAQRGLPCADIALAWTMNQPGITSAIIGPRSLEQLEENLRAMEVTLTPDDQAELDAIFPPGRMTSPFYDADFGPHLHRQA
jgi:aryl-alcohol dehydrogenase-like predicted oxidoreductase